jgi:LacI family transcriptional regulator
MLVDEFNNLINQNSYSLLLGISGDKIINERKYIEMFIGKDVEGIIIVPTIETRPDLCHLYKLRNFDIPFVFCTASYNGFSEPCIMTDLREGEYQIVKYLISRGMRKIHFVTGNRELQLSRLRLDGYIQAFEESKLTYRSEWIIRNSA